TRSFPICERAYQLLCPVWANSHKRPMEAFVSNGNESERKVSARDRLPPARTTGANGDARSGRWRKRGNRRTRRVSRRRSQVLPLRTRKAEGIHCVCAGRPQHG